MPPEHQEQRELSPSPGCTEQPCLMSIKQSGSVSVTWGWSLQSAAGQGHATVLTRFDPSSSLLHFPPLLSFYPFVSSRLQERWFTVRVLLLLVFTIQPTLLCPVYASLCLTSLLFCPQDPFNQQDGGWHSLSHLLHYGLLQKKTKRSASVWFVAPLLLFISINEKPHLSPWPLHDHWM